MNFQQELQRKLIHLSSTVYPLLYYFLNRSVTMVIVVSIFHVVLFWDLLRLRGFQFKILNFINIFLRPTEKNGKKLTGATYFMMAILLVTMIFPKSIAILSMLVLIYADTAAALVGKFGKIKIKSLNKTLEGFIAYNLMGLLIVLGYYEILQMMNIHIYFNFFVILLAVFVSGLAELFAKKLFFDDNLLITLSFASVNYVGNYFYNVM